MVELSERTALIAPLKKTQRQWKQIEPVLFKRREFSTLQSHNMHFLYLWVLGFTGEVLSPVCTFNPPFISPARSVLSSGRFLQKMGTLTENVPLWSSVETVDRLSESILEFFQKPGGKKLPEKKYAVSLWFWWAVWLLQSGQAVILAFSCKVCWFKVW